MRLSLFGIALCFQGIKLLVNKEEKVSYKDASSSYVSCSEEQFPTHTRKTMAVGIPVDSYCSYGSFTNG